jgi:hypothetical protein
LTALLVLAIAASSSLVFTNRVELLKLAVILALWAAVVAAFVSVIYRRQSDVDAATARDLKLVYDLQLDREISARREYELTVESHLRRELASELRAQSADEVAALRAELAALRNNLEILFDADLAHRPAIETERTTVRAYSDWERDARTTDPGRRSSRRFTTATREDLDTSGAESSIIDVPEEPPEPEAPVSRHSPEYAPPPYGGAHRMPSDYVSPTSPPRPEPHPEPVFTPPPPRLAEPERAAEPQPEPVGRNGPLEEPVTATANEWQPVAAEGQWLPPGAPGSNWVPPPNGVSMSRPGTTEPAPTPVSPEPRPGRHSGQDEPVLGATGAAQPTFAPRFTHPTPDTVPPPPPTRPGEPAPRHGSSVEPPAANSQHGEGQGQSVAELLARLQGGSTGGGRRRRRDD